MEFLGKAILLGSMLLLTGFSPPRVVAQDSEKAPAPGQGEQSSRPTCQYCPNPNFPLQARNAKISSASVLLEVTVTEKGKVDPHDILVINDPGYGFAREAVDAVKNWKLKPAIKNGKPIEVRTKVEVVFPGV